MTGHSRTTTLRLARCAEAPFDGRFFERDERLWPIVGAAQVFAAREGWPAPEEYELAFRGRVAPVRFERDEPRKRPRGEPIDVERMYDARIVRGVVPTRACNWHDFLNALVWATFPRSKMALHRRQYALIRAWIPPGATALPNARTRDQDTLALLDEGGVLLLKDPSREVAIPFGHGLLEGVSLATPAMIPRGFLLHVEDLPGDPDRLLEFADGALSSRIDSLPSPVRLARLLPSGDGQTLAQPAR